MFRQQPLKHIGQRQPGVLAATGNAHEAVSVSDHGMIPLTHPPAYSAPPI